MDLKDLHADMTQRFDRVEAQISANGDKLDAHLDRISRAEEAISWIKGHMKTAAAVATAVVGGLIGALLKLLGVTP